MSRVLDRLTAIVASPLRAVRFMVRGERQVAELRELTRAGKKATADLATSVRRADQRLEKHGERLTVVQRDIEDVRRELSDRLRQTNLQLGAIMRAVQQLGAPADGRDGNGQGVTTKRLSGGAIPLAINAEEAQWSPVIGGDLHPDPAGNE